MHEIFLSLNKLTRELEELNVDLLQTEFEETELYFPKGDIYNSLINTIEDGIKAHKNNERLKAWHCFNYHANLGSMLAKYWKGYYLWEGYQCEKNEMEAAKLFKEAADDGVPDAQLRYAFTLVVGNKITNEKLFLQYIEKAAYNNNITAQYNLGDIYFNGRMRIKKDKNLGKLLFQIAAQNGHPKAIEILKQLDE